MLDKMNELYQQMIQNYEGGLSNTSTKKFDGIVSSIAGMLGIPENEVYATGSGSRPGNLEVRLSQGVRATTHTTVGLGFIVDEKNTPENAAGSFFFRVRFHITLSISLFRYYSIFLLRIQ